MITKETVLDALNGKAGGPTGAKPEKKKDPA